MAFKRIITAVQFWGINWQTGNQQLSPSDINVLTWRESFDIQRVHLKCAFTVVQILSWNLQFISFWPFIWNSLIHGHQIFTSSMQLFFLGAKVHACTLMCVCVFVCAVLQNACDDVLVDVQCNLVDLSSIMIYHSLSSF